MINNFAYAEEIIQTSQDMNQSSLMSFLPFIMIFVIFYFMLIRPQMKKQKEHQNLLSSVKVGEKVVTTSGIIGTVTKIENDNSTMIIEISQDVKIKMLKSSIVEILDKNKVTESKQK